MKRQTRSSALGVLALVMVLSTTAWAGRKANYSVAITFSGDTGAASGAMGSARNSDDTVQYIGCTVSASLANTSIDISRAVTCSARNASNVTVACTSTEISIIETAYAIASDSYIRFEWGPGGQCTALSVRNYSYQPPKEL